MKSQHPDVVHGPNTEPHRHSPAVQPEEAGLAVRRGYPSGKIKSGIGSEDRDRYRQGYKQRIVGADKNQLWSRHGRHTLSFV